MKKKVFEKHSTKDWSALFFSHNRTKVKLARLGFLTLTMSSYAVTKRDGKRQEVSFDKILRRVRNLCHGLDPVHVRPVDLAKVVIAGLYDGIPTSELDDLAAQCAADKVFSHNDFGVLAARIAISNLHKETDKSFSKTAQILFHCTDAKTGRPTPLLNQTIMDIVNKHADKIDSWIDHARDYELSYFGYKTLEKSYLLRVKGKTVERPQYLHMRVALCIHGENLEKVRETYDLLSQGFITHATPTMTNAGTPRGQLGSCYLLGMQSDSIEGIYDTLKQTALISKGGGGIGLSVHNIRASGTYIAGTGGRSNGLVPMINVFNSTARYVDQGGNKRPGAFALYLEPWHADIFEFLDLKKNTGVQELRSRDLFYAMWIPDLFMQRVQENKKWTLMCPHECPGLDDVWGDKFKELYERYEQEGRGRKQVDAQKLWYAILESQQETGTPYMLYKDSCNSKSNQQNLGTIKCSNLCCEIVEYTSRDEVANCNLGSLCPHKCVIKPYTNEASFDFELLHSMARVMTVNLNRVIDVTSYPMPEAECSNKRHRPIGIGIQSLADVFAMMRMPFVSERAQELNRQIFETIYHGALTASMELAKIDGPYSSFSTSPSAQGILQFDMWGVDPGNSRYDWNKLKDEIKVHGLRNSLLIAPMPTASTAQILNNNEGAEPFTSNMYTRRVNAGEFQVINKHLIRELSALNLWNETTSRDILANKGSVQSLTYIPEWIREVYRTVWEIKQRPLVDMAADRGAYICQSQSFNVFMDSPDNATLTALHFYAWRKGLKTGMYYLRTKAATEAIQFTAKKKTNAASVAAKADEVGGVDEKGEEEHKQQQKKQKEQQKISEQLSCSLANREACTACSS